MTRAVFYTILVFILFTNRPGYSQEPIISGDSLMFIENTLKKTGNVSFTIMPGPVYNTTQKLGFAILPVLVYDIDPADSISPPSSTALMIYYNFKTSWSVALRQSFYWNQNKWRATLGGGYGQFDHKFFGIGRDTMIIDNSEDNYDWAELSSSSANVSCFRKIYKSLFFGMTYNFFHSNLSGRDSATNSEMEAQGLRTGYQSESILVPSFVWDSRDNIFWSLKGYYATLNLQLADNLFLSDYNYQVLSGFFNGYHALKPGNKRLSLAWHFYFQSGRGDLPYLRLANYGKGDNATGYTSGKYINNSEFSAQTEIRYDVWKFIGLGAYAGTGKVMHNIDTFSESVWLHFAGARFYTNMIPSRNIRLRVDVAFARKDFGVYVGIGQAF